MDNLHFECTARISSFIDLEEFAACVKDLAPQPDGATPFCLSFELRKLRNGVFCEPTCHAWFELEGQIARWPLGAHAPELTQAYAIQIVSFLTFHGLRKIAEDILCDCLDETQGGIYHFGVCSDGCLIIADRPDFIAKNFGPEACIGAIASSDQSNHTRVSGHHGLKTCAEAMLSYLRRDHFIDTTMDVRISIPSA
jgi:hypothetical protein